MKRPEGFDPPGRQEPPPPRKPVVPRKPAVPRARPVAPPRQEKHPAQQPPRRQPVPRTSREPRPDAVARAELRRAARERRRFERAEVRRFTRRARARRMTILVAAGVVVTLVVLVLTAVYSPILALRHVTVDGTSRVDPAEVSGAVDPQLGTPLALIDYGAITRQLGAFPLIRSYVTEVVPPDTLLIHVTERQPVGSVGTASGFELVDPAGVTLQQSAERIPGVPLIDLAGESVGSTAFTSMVEVLLVLPPDLLARVDTISARTQDDVALTLAGVGQGVIWGSADDSVKKAKLLAALIGVTDAGAPGVFDVSAPGNGVFRPS